MRPQTGHQTQWQQQRNAYVADQLQKPSSVFQVTVKENLMMSYIKYKRHYDSKADATRLNNNDYSYVLNPKANNQSIKFTFDECIWTGPYRVVEDLSNNNYTIRRLRTPYTQHSTEYDYEHTTLYND